MADDDSSGVKPILRSKQCTDRQAEMNQQADPDADVNSRLQAAFANRKENVDIMREPVQENDAIRNRVSSTMEWDEDNLRINESEKVPRQKIDDPPTPFLEQDEEEILNLNDDDMEEEPEVPGVNLQKGATTMLLSDPGALARLAKDAAKRQQDMMQEEELTEEEKKKKAFEARRKAHYNEGLMWKAIQAKANKD